MARRQAWRSLRRQRLQLPDPCLQGVLVWALLVWLMWLPIEVVRGESMWPDAGRACLPAIAAASAMFLLLLGLGMARAWPGERRGRLRRLAPFVFAVPLVVALLVAVMRWTALDAELHRAATTFVDRILFIECVSDRDSREARIGRVRISEAGHEAHYAGRTFVLGPMVLRETGTGRDYYFAPPTRDGQDGLGGLEEFKVEIDENAREEYWTRIRGEPERIGERAYVVDPSRPGRPSGRARRR